MMPPNDDGVALVSASHPRLPWYKRVWSRWFPPRLDSQMLETLETELPISDERKATLIAAGMWDDPRVREVYLREYAKYDRRVTMSGIEEETPKAPKVTLVHIESCIAYEYYITGDQIPQVTTAVLGVAHPQVPTSIDITPLSCLTLCVLVLKNGFTVTGESACASPENFDAELGRKLARSKAVDKIWMLEGYLLKQALFDEANPSECDPRMGLSEAWKNRSE